MRNDLLGVSSFVRALGLSEHFYEHLLHFFHSNAVKTDRLAELWFAIVIKHFPVYKIGCRPVLVLDGIKKSKEGRKMPAVKYLHQQSEVQFQASLHHEPFLSGLRRALSGWRILLLRSGLCTHSRRYRHFKPRQENLDRQGQRDARIRL